MTEIDDRKLLEAIEHAFSDAQYPGDDNLVYDNSPNAWPDVVITKQHFLGKHWKDLPFETVNDHRDDLPAFTPVAFCYYLPAFLIACLAHSEDVDVLPDNLVYAFSIDYGSKETVAWISAVISTLTPQQKSVLVDFFKCLSEEHFYVIPDELYKKLGRA